MNAMIRQAQKMQDEISELQEDIEAVTLLQPQAAVQLALPLPAKGP